MDLELRILKSISKKVLPKKTFNKIKKLSSISQKKDLFKYHIKSNLYLRFEEINQKISSLDSNNSSVIDLMRKANLLNFKIKYFLIGYEKKEFKEILKLFKELEKEINKKDVWIR